MSNLNCYQSLKDCLEDNPQSQFGVTLGNFDGVHLGHQFLIFKMVEECRRNNLTPIVLTFNPHPKMILIPQEGFKLLTTYEERRTLLLEQGVEHVVEVPFTRDFSTQSPEHFLQDHLLLGDQVQKIFFGHDFNFGKNKSGNFEFLKNFVQGTKCKVEQLPPFATKEGETISSSSIRQYIESGNMEKAELKLGRNFYLSGLVRKGEGRGKQIGFPTANLEIPDYRMLPSQGVYISTATYNKMKYKAVTNVGRNPTFKDDKVLTVETHLFDFDKDIYGECLIVEFHKKLRDEKKFDSVNDLIAQIKLDTQEAKKFFL